MASIPICTATISTFLGKLPKGFTHHSGGTDCTLAGASASRRAVGYPVSRERRLSAGEVVIAHGPQRTKNFASEAECDLTLELSDFIHVADSA